MSDVGIIVGSHSDMETMEHCLEKLRELDITFDLIVKSAHRDPHGVREWVEQAEDLGNRVIIAAAGMSAALPGVVASLTKLPVIGVPMTSELSGMDSLLSISQMPSGVPVACMSIGKAGAINAALLVKRILELVTTGDESKFRPGSASAYSRRTGPSVNIIE